MSKYRARRKAENHADCNECGITDDDCTTLILTGNGACCPTCGNRNTHPIKQQRSPDFPPSDPREGRAMQASMFQDADSIGKAPVTPYAGSIGHVNTPTSKKRAAKSPVGKNQKRAITMIEAAAGWGITVVDLRDTPDMHHGSASGVLSNLHKHGTIACLIEERDGCHVYVLPKHVDGRGTREPAVTKAGLAGRVASCKQVMVDEVEHVEYDGGVYYLASTLLEALMEGYEA